jgi:hypothetical protein
MSLHLMYSACACLCCRMLNDCRIDTLKIAEYVGVDMRRPKIAFSLHIIVMHSIFKFLRPDEDNGAVWCPLYNAEQAALALTKDKDIAPSALSTFFSNTLPEIATVDPIAAKGGKVLHVVDADLFSEALTNLIMSSDPRGLDSYLS